MGVNADRIKVIDSTQGAPIPALVSTWVKDVSALVAESLPECGEPDHPILLAWGTHVFAPVELLEVTADGVALSGPLEQDFNRATRVRGKDDPQLPALKDLLTILRPGVGCFARQPDGVMHQAIGHRIVHQDIGYGHGVWNVLSMAGSHPPI